MTCLAYFLRRFLSFPFFCVCSPPSSSCPVLILLLCPRAQLHEEKDLCVAPKDVKEANDVWVAQVFEDLNLVVDRDVLRVTLLDVDDLEGALLPRRLVHDLAHFGKGTAVCVFVVVIVTGEFFALHEGERERGGRSDTHRPRRLPISKRDR